MIDEPRYFDQEAANWDDNAGRVKMALNIAAAMLQTVEIRSDMEVLDFGCGTGLITLQFQPLVRAVTGVDSSAGMIKVLQDKIQERQLRNVTALQLDVTKGDKLSGSYDLVISSMTLHHVPDIEPLLAQFYQILKPGGQLCIADLDPDQGHFHGVGNNKGVAHFGFERKQLGMDLAAAGFREVDFRTATEIVRFYPGGVKPFSIFLATARKPA